MNKRDIVVGVILVAGLAGLIYYWQRPQEQPEELRVPQTLSVEDEIERVFNIQIPEDIDKAELASTGDSDNLALATRKYENETFEMTVLADLPEPEAGSFYKAWIQRGESGEEGYSLLPLGRLRLAKGGYMVDYSSNVDYSDHSKVIISRETTDDNQIENKLLEGSF